MNTLFLEPGILAIHTQVLDTQMHQHALMQLTLPDQQSTLAVANQAPVHNMMSLLDANVPHQLTMQQGWVILIEPSSPLGLQASKLLAHHDVVTWPLKAQDNHSDNLTDLLARVKLTYATNSATYDAHLDPRIAALLKQLNRCFNHDCLKPEHWLAKDIAQSLGLSESRFLHVFKDNMQLPWRPYLLWRRLMCAIQSLSRGETATQAAYISGFADSAHLSRTFKKQFGITLRSAIACVKKPTS
ncbi:helix-turn-helix domain-containing protein [Pseudoalteromonas sp. S16_S37]|uniref:helix-turn-helix domain-containing protein n=1 Tax=Pseudoalteromonas sp. S16_S37 TaxID=2720228 RepID=UPI0016816F5D|nr:helix-turn-helix domain-containing protein [Pseudoalteromonas sp. S16_S37]MBD1582114.1 AraC family transcriptional regulator [Pseudoalteromonas sp. S16_S37]